MKFRDLAIGDTFDFIDDEHLELTSYFRMIQKISVRKYTTVFGPPFETNQVGSINVEVFHVEKGQQS